MENEIIIDAQGAVAGRLAGFAAKKALQGNKIIVVNAEKARIIGRKKIILDDYIKRRALGKGVQKGPHFPYRADMILRRIIRGMLPRKRTTGREAFRSIKCFISIPAEYQNKIKDAVKFETKNALNYLTLEELSKLIRYNG